MQNVGCVAQHLLSAIKFSSQYWKALTLLAFNFSNYKMKARAHSKHQSVILIVNSRFDTVVLGRKSKYFGVFESPVLLLLRAFVLSSVIEYAQDTVGA